MKIRSATGAEALEYPLAGSPVALRVKFFSVHISENADCTGLVEIARFPGGRVANLVEEPTLVEVELDDASYRCVVLEVEDQLAVIPDASAAEAPKLRTTASAS